MTITVSVRDVYGQRLVYPACDTAINLARLTGKKTFSASDIATIKKLGYEIITEQIKL